MLGESASGRERWKRSIEEARGSQYWKRLSMSKWIEDDLRPHKSWVLIKVCWKTRLETEDAFPGPSLRHSSLVSALHHWHFKLISFCGYCSNRTWDIGDICQHEQDWKYWLTVQRIMVPSTMDQMFSYDFPQQDAGPFSLAPFLIVTVSDAVERILYYCSRTGGIPKCQCPSKPQSSRPPVDYRPYQRPLVECIPIRRVDAIWGYDRTREDWHHHQTMLLGTIFHQLPAVPRWGV